MKNIRKSKAFTLVELLIVIAIIGVLAGLIYPALQGGMASAEKMKSMNSASNIAKSWLSYVKTGTRTRIVVGSDIYEWASVLAEKQDLNDPSIWILDFDKYTLEKQGEGAAMPLTVANRTGQNWSLNPEFKAYALSWEVANKTLPDASSNTPLVWSRGLKPSGEWDATEGVFGRNGGHIAFVDAHVMWYDSLRDENTRRGVLTVYGETQPTFNIYQAIRGGASNVLKSNVE